MKFLTQIAALLLTLQLSFCKVAADKIDGAAEKGLEIARHGITQKKMIFLADFTIPAEPLCARNTTSVEQQQITLALNFTQNDNEEKLKKCSAENVMDNYDWASMRRFNREEPLILNEDNNGTNGNTTVGTTTEKPCQWLKETPACIPPDCIEAYKEFGVSGVYKIKPRGVKTPFHVYCLEDSDQGDAWTVIQRRSHGQVDFNRNWQQYKLGFGDLDDEFWLGNDNIYMLTNSARYELRITLENWKNSLFVAYYDSFMISNEATNYTLKSTGKHSGNATDAFIKYHAGQMFSTKDRDNDMSRFHCAVHYKGGWWFRNCVTSNLNGEYPRKPNSKKCKKVYQGIIWSTLSKHSFKGSEMAIRRSKLKRM